MRWTGRLQTYVGMASLAVLIGCGGASTGAVADEIADGDIGALGAGEGTGNASGDSSGSGPDRGQAGEDSASQVPRCRTYASSYSTVYDSDAGDSSETTCRFDSSSVRLNCALSGEYVFDSNVEKHYDSVDDFVFEGAAFGRVTWQTSVDVKPSGEVNYTETATYDSDGRLTALDTTRGGETTAYWTEAYSRWDSFGRPIEGQMEFRGRYGECVNWGVAWSYDNALRSVTRIFSGGEGDGCYDEATVRLYDEHGNELSSVSDDNSGWITSEDRTLIEFEEVCRGS